MSKTTTPPSLLGRLMTKLELYAPVPEDMAYCEFNCRKLDCSAEEFENCANRKPKDPTSQTAAPP